MNVTPSFFKCLCIPAAVVSVASVALFVMVALPLRGKIASESDDIQKFRAKIENAERKISRLPELGAQFSVVKEDERKISRLLPEERAVDFIEEVERIAKDIGGGVAIAQGSAVESAKKKAAPKKEGVEDGAAQKKAVEAKTIAEDLSWEKRLPLQITFSGEYAKAVNFLHKIETMSYRLDVVSVDMRPIVPEERDGRGNATPSVAVDGAESVPVTIESDKPSVTAVFNLVVYTE
jgi:Tfp pilus assembly protein PilO